MVRLLIADDEMIEREVLYKTLRENLGDRCTIFQAENGREALEIYQKEKIQIAVLDIEMPGINGIEAAERIREQDKECCIIFLTAFDEFAYAKKAITVRAMDYLLKPYDEQELMLVLEEAMHQAGEREDKTGDFGKAKDTEARKTAERETAKEQSYEADNENVRMVKVTDVINQYIQENYRCDISMQDAARHMNYSEAYFCKLFKQCFGRNFTSYLTEYRVNEAKRLLTQPTVNIKEIGKAVGYADSNYFTKVFRRITGQSPTEYRVGIFRKEREQ